MNCNAGADCAEYYLAVLDSDLSLIQNKMIAKDYSQGEQNEFLKTYKINDGILSLTIVNEDFDQETEDYTEKETNITYKITETGQIVKINN